MTDAINRTLDGQGSEKRDLLETARLDRDHSLEFPSEEKKKKKAQKHKKNSRDTSQVSPGHPAGQTGVYHIARRGKLTEKGFLAWIPAGCPGNAPLSRGLSEISCSFFFLCDFFAPYSRGVSDSRQPPNCAKRAESKENPAIPEILLL